MLPPSVLDVTVSCFANFWAVENPRPVNLLHWLTSAKYAQQVIAIRQLTSKTRRDKLKAGLPAITPSGTFTRRDSSALVEHSG